MHHEFQDEPHLADQASRHQAEGFVRSLVRWVGPGFHPDTDFNDYAIVDAGTRSFTPSQASRLNAELDRAFAVLGDDLYDIAAPVQHALLESCFRKSSFAP